MFSFQEHSTFYANLMLLYYTGCADLVIAMVYWDLMGHVDGMFEFKKKNIYFGFL